MNRNWLLISVAGCIVPLACPCHAATPGEERGSADDLLYVYLPREVTVQNPLLSLGQVSVVRGGGVLSGGVGGIQLGRLSLPGQKIVLDRATILSRLASHGIPAEKVRLTGAQTVIVRRRQQTISGDELVTAARAFLQQNPPVASFCESIAAAKPKDLVLPGESVNLQLAPRFVENNARGFMTVQVGVVVDGQEVGSRDIPLRLRYRCRKAVTVQEIAQGAALTPETVKVEEVLLDRPEPAGWKPPYGLVALRTLPADTEVRGDMTDTPQPSIIIRRNETVVIRIQRPGILVTAAGLALQEARAGEYVKVRNTDSHRVIVCKVSADGTVEPVL